MIQGLHNIIRLDDPIGAEIKNWTPKNGINMSQKRVGQIEKACKA